MKEIFQALQAYIGQIPGVQDCRRYNNQLQREKDESFTLIHPSVLIEFVAPEKQQRPGSRIVDTTLTVRLYVTDNSPNQGEDYEIFDLVEDVKRYLHSYRAGGLLLPLALRGETTDTNNSNVSTHQLEYKTGYTELLPPPVAPLLVSLTDVSIAIDLDIDNHILNLGDNKNYSF